MGRSTPNRALRLRWIFCCLLLARPSLPAREVRPLRSAVVKIYTTLQSEDYAMPWQGGRLANGTGSGFVIPRRRILTNAHVVSNTRFLEIQKDGHPGRFQARVAFIAHDCDLAVLEVDDPSFFDGTRPLPFADALPRLGDEVLVLGYPTGGERISLTRGIVSRIDYSAYSHSGVDYHLVLQVDAAINPGNSGGPILYKGKIVGLAFQGLAWAENIGYGIPLPVIRHFLEDIADGTYHGYPELGAGFMPLRNPALRADLKMPPRATGVVLCYIDPFGSGRGLLRERDVLLEIDGRPIANDGTIELNGNNVLFAELLERKQWGDSIELAVWREGDALTIKVPLTNPPDPFVFRNLYDERPQYYVLGGLVFSPLTREYLKTIDRRETDAGVQQLFYFSSHHVKLDGLHEGRDEFVVLTARLPHPVNTYADDYVNGILSRLNGRPIRGMADLPSAAAVPTNGFHVLCFEGMHGALVLDAQSCRRADREVQTEYGLSQMQFLKDPGDADRP